MTDAAVGLLVVMTIVFGVLGIIVLLFACFVWPTFWRYERASGHLVRIRRTSGAAYILTPQGWQPLSAESPVIHFSTN